MIQDNSLVKKILELPVIFDIIISDFGREATNRYLKLIELKEKNIISKILKKNSRVFYDEYRRIMYTVIADLNYFKNAEILKATQENGFISDEILIGLGNTQISNVFFERVTFSVIHNVNLAILHGHNTIRITIPCNSLSFVTESILKILKDEDQLGKFINKYNIEKSAKDAILNCNIFGRTVPKAVLSYISDKNKNNKKLNLIILGVKEANIYYKKLAKEFNINILSLKKSEYEIIELAVIASINGELQDLKRIRKLLQDIIIQPRKEKYENIVVIEACTDFTFGIGKNSLTCFADVMVRECYFNSVIL